MTNSDVAKQFATYCELMNDVLFADEENLHDVKRVAEKCNSKFGDDNPFLREDIKIDYVKRRETKMEMNKLSQKVYCTLYPSLDDRRKERCPFKGWKDVGPCLAPCVSSSTEEITKDIEFRETLKKRGGI